MKNANISLHPCTTNAQELKQFLFFFNNKAISVNTSILTSEISPIPTYHSLHIFASSIWPIYWKILLPYICIGISPKNPKMDRVTVTDINRLFVSGTGSCEQETDMTRQIRPNQERVHVYISQYVYMTLEKNDLC